ncbi:MAG: signal transduction histidine kinase [Candidatus Aldehydirespiratoraceae bacterium]|jgi:signal transduction histidine kinase
MLKRIKIRGKLLLLLATPLVAVMVFAYSGIIDRTDRTTFQESEARIATLAETGADLSLAIEIERIRVLEVQRLDLGTDNLLGPEQAETNERLAVWIAAIERSMGDLSDEQLRDEFRDLAERLPNTIAPDRRSDSVTGALLGSASNAVNEVTLELASQAQDLDLFRALSDFNEVLNIQVSYSTITSTGSEAIFQGQTSAVAATILGDAERSAQTSVETFNANADDQYKTMLSRLQNTEVLPNPMAGTVDAVADIQEYIDDPSRGGVLEWLVQGGDQLRALNEIIGAVLRDATATAKAEAATANEEAQSFLILAGSVILLALTMAIVIGRSISRPLTRLTRNAEQLSSEELPALVESMRSASRSETPVLTPIESKGRDEVAQLAHAISEIQQVTIDVAEEQGDLLRRGISDIFVNLARRNQSLLDRQIDFIDQLESCEENPDALENLFRLDHLATRMRRNAESLLVLAGAEPTRRRGRPVEIVDILRVAMGEIEDFSRIELMSVDGSTVAGSVAVDLAHLMSELMENATQFSPPTASVDVVGYRIADGSYQLTLADHGIGMSAEQITTANKTLTEPPLVGLDLSRSLGFTVVSRLAHRLGVAVQLTAGTEGGVTAVVTVPAEMVGEIGSASVDAPPPATDPASESLAPAAAAPLTPVASDEGDLFAAFGTPAGIPRAPADPDADLFAGIDEAPTAVALFTDAHPAVAPPAAAAPLPTRDPAAVGTVSPDVTSAGLIRRTPKQVDVPEQSKYSPGAPQPSVASEALAPTASRSPDEVRQMLSRYRAGLRKGRGPGETDQPNRRS